MDTDINDIWDLPLENPVNNPDGDGPTSSPRVSNPPLFLPSDDEGDAAPDTNANANARNEASNPDVDALFEGLDDIDDSFQDLAPALDLDALRREADARNARAVRAELGATTNIPAAAESSTATGAAARSKTNRGRGGGVLDGLDADADGEDDGKKKRKPLPKLDETRLLGKDGFLQLLKDTKNFKPKGKGHETVDLDRVLQLYQFWSHKLYPKTRFKETVNRVEKLCHSKRMQVALSVWHDEAKGLVNGVRLPTADDDNDNDSDEDSEAGGAPRDNETARTAAATAVEDAATSSTSPPSSPARSRLRHNGSSGGAGISAVSDSDRDSDATRPPSSSPDRDRDQDRDETAIELDALLLEAEAASSHASTHNATSTSHTWKGTSNGDVIAMDEDEDLWDALDMDAGAVASAPVTATATTPAPPPAMDDDQEMWDIVHELEQEEAKETAHRPDPPVQIPPATSDAQLETDDLDDLYL